MARRIAGMLFVAALLLAGGAEAQSNRFPENSGGMLGRVMRDSVTGRIVPAPPVLETHVCVAMTDDPACELTSLQSALSNISLGGTVVLHPGRYAQAARVPVDRTRIQALPGAELYGTSLDGKAALVITANDVVIEGLACSGISVRDRNGACVRLEGKNLTLRNVHFFDSEQGLLSGGDRGLILVEDSRFENLGAGGRAHGIYVGGGELVIRRSVFIASKGQGHEIKSRATRTTVEDNVVASLNSKDSYLIDLPNGGDATIRRNVLQEGPVSSNNGAIAFAMEGNRYDESRLRVEDNVILMDRKGGILVKAKGFQAELAGNVIVGPAGAYHLGETLSGCGESGNVCLGSRDSLGPDGSLPLPRMPGLGRILSETGLWRH